jgi:hypothetical protein
MIAILRLGDCRFVTDTAMEAYNKVIESKSVDADYDIIKKSHVLWLYS